LVNLDRVHALKASNQLDADLKQQLRQQLERIQQMQLDDTSEASESQPLRKIADWILLQWGPEERKLLEIHE
jgi:predicted DNA-binding transcriptional regulator YafY